MKIDRLYLVAVVIIINNHEPKFCANVKPNYPSAAYDERYRLASLPKKPFNATPQ